MSSPLNRLRENITSVTALLVIGLGIAAIVLGVPNAWLIFVIGLVVVVPIVGLLLGDEDWKTWDPFQDEFWEDAFEEGSDSKGERDVDGTTALETLRDRYARGELTDEQFERKLERLLETETLEDVEDRVPERE